MIVIDLNNQAERIVDFIDTTVEKKNNGEQTLTFTALNTEKNKYAYALLQDESIVKIGSESYIIKIIDESPYGKEVTALISFFECIDDYVEESWPDGLYTIQESLQLAFSTSQWSYVIGDSYPQRAKLEGFGNDNTVSMLNKIINAFDSEYEVNTESKVVTIKRQIGRQTDYPIMYRHNMQSINVKTDSNNVKTRVKVFYNMDEFGKYNSSITYISPNESKYPRPKWREPIMSENITTAAAAISTARLILKDTPDVTITTEFTVLRNNGYDSDDIQIGNGVYLIDDRMDIKMSARITEIKEFPYSNQSPIVTISSYQKVITDTLVDQKINQATIENNAVIQHSIYNGCTITKEEGFKAVAENGVETVMNASQGISVKRNGRLKFFVDAIDDELTMDGRLKVTSGNIVVMEGYKDTNGGMLKIYDTDAHLNVEIGSNRNNSSFTGGSLTLYNDGSTIDEVRAQMRISRSTDSGEMSLRDSTLLEKIQLEATNNFTGDARIRVTSDNNVDMTDIRPDYIEVFDGTWNTVITSEDVYIRNVAILREIQLLWDAIDDLS